MKELLQMLVAVFYIYATMRKIGENNAMRNVLCMFLIA